MSFGNVKPDNLNHEGHEEHEG